MTSFLTAWQFLTILPVSGGADLSRAVRYTPLVGFGLGCLLALADLALTPYAGPLVRAALLVALLAILTGALHLDGLADSADGLLVQRSREDRLAILRDPRVGGFGVAAVCLTLIVKTAAIAELDGPRWAVLIAVPAIARWLIVLQARALPGARQGGLGAIWREGAGNSAIVVATVPCLAAVAVAGWRGLAALVVAGLAGLAIGALAQARIGGVTGDVFGATVELAEAAGWVAAGMIR